MDDLVGKDGLVGRREGLEAEKSMEDKLGEWYLGQNKRTIWLGDSNLKNKLRVGKERTKSYFEEQNFGKKKWQKWSHKRDFQFGVSFRGKCRFILV